MTDLEYAFRLLDIAPTDDEKKIRRAWRGLVRSYHPDMARTDPESANKRLAEINAAFDAVSSCTLAQVRQLQRTRAERLRRINRARRAKMNDAQHIPQTSALIVVTQPMSSQQQCSDKTHAPVADSPAPGSAEDFSRALIADQGFNSAMRVCSRIVRARPRSLYL